VWLSADGPAAFLRAGVHDIAPLEACLKDAGVEYTRSMSGRPAIFFRDPDSNCLECVELEAWR
jgi:glyoxylase I family protein